MDPTRMEAYVPLAKRLARDMARRCHGAVRYDDLFSYALEGLWRACKPGTWKPARGASFGTYAMQQITWSMQRLLRARKRAREKRVMAAESSYAMATAERYLAGTDRLATADLVAFALRGLRPKLRRPVSLYFLDGHSMHEVGRREGFTRSNCSLVIKQGLAEMRENLGRGS